MAGVAARRALTQYVLKVHSRCDLACDHCYIYEHADQGWRARPTVMAAATVAAAAHRIAEHAARHRLKAVHVILHGGEPLLLGVAGLRAVIEELRSTIEPVTQLYLRLQSNGVRLTPAMCELFVEHEVKVGISLDGDRSANDRHRRFANQASSHEQVHRALQLLRQPRYRPAYAGILCTIDVANDPIRVYEALLAEDPPRIDFLLPHATWDHPPVRPDGRETPYADWLLAIYRRWEADGRPVSVRLFDSLQSTASGGPSGTEALGLDPVDLAVVETDGWWEQADSLKTAYDGAARTGLTVFAHSVDQVAEHHGIASRQAGLASLCAECRACPVVRQCGGGLYAHRYRTGQGFDNPSVFCRDLKELIASIVEPIGPRHSPSDQLEKAVLRPDVLDEIAVGHVTAETVALLDALADEAVEALLQEVADRFDATLADHPWEVLVRLSDEAPVAVRNVLGHPYVRVWALRCLSGSGGADAQYLGNVAVAAAVCTGRAAELPVTANHGVVHLPTVGGAHIGTATGPVTAMVDDHGRLTVRCGGRSLVVSLHGDGEVPVGWRSTRRVYDGPWSPVLDDGDPYRDCYGLPVAADLAAAEACRWETALTGARAVIDRDAAGHQPGLVAGLRVVTPLRADPGAPRSAAAREAYGAVAAARTGAEALAVLLVREYQHVKLGAVLDHWDLYDVTSPLRLPVGWRPDPQPVEGVLQGAYAHLAMTEIWRSREGQDAHTRFRRYHTWTADAIHALLASGALTASGQRFVDRMGQTLHSWA